MSCDHLSSTLSCSNGPLCRRPSVFPVALLRGVHGGTVPAMDAIPAMSVEEHQVLDPWIVRQSVDEIQLCDRRSAPASLLRVELANAHESSSPRLLGERWIDIRNGHFGTCSGAVTYWVKSAMSTGREAERPRCNRLIHNALRCSDYSWTSSARTSRDTADCGKSNGDSRRPAAFPGSSGAAPTDPSHLPFR